MQVCSDFETVQALRYTILGHWVQNRRMFKPSRDTNARHGLRRLVGALHVMRCQVLDNTFGDQDPHILSGSWLMAFQRQGCLSITCDLTNKGWGMVSPGASRCWGRSSTSFVGAAFGPRDEG